MRKMVNSRLKGNVKNFKTRDSAWRIFKNIVLYKHRCFAYHQEPKKNRKRKMGNGGGNRLV